MDILRPQDDYPGPHPWPLAHLLRHVEWQIAENGEVPTPLVLDLVDHLNRLEGVRVSFEDLLMRRGVTT